MTRFEYFKSLSIEKAAQFLCSGIEFIADDYPCHYCPRAEDCKVGRNGWAEWLSEEVHKA